ncbi:MAG: OB-fold nucleic acid binding domain-containing protein [Candidatus Pacearchaeota archaeon]
MDKISKISLLISMTGIIILLALNNLRENEINKVSDINENLLHKSIKIVGKPDNMIVNKNNFTIFSLSDETGKIKVTCNCPDIKNNETIEVIGKVIEYAEGLEVRAEIIKVYKY